MISMTISTITSRMKTKISRMEKETPVPERGTGVFLSGNQFDIEGEENEKGEIYEESWKESISRIKDVYMWRARRLP